MTVDDEYIMEVVRDKLQLPKLGVVDQVREHTSPDDRWDFHCDVEFRDGAYKRKVPVAFPCGDFITPPERGDLVLVQFINSLSGSSERPIITRFVPNNEDRPLLGQAGLIRAKRGSLYFEMQPDGNWARLARKPGDADSPTMKVEVNDETGTIEIDAGDNDVNVTAGKVNVNDGTNAVAVEGDTVTVDGVESGANTVTGTIDSKDGDIEVSK